MSELAAHRLRAVLRWPLAVLLIPFGVLLGVLGLLDNICRGLADRRR